LTFDSLSFILLTKIRQIKYQIYAAMAREYDHLFKLLIIGDSGMYK